MSIIQNNNFLIPNDFINFIDVRFRFTNNNLFLDIYIPGFKSEKDKATGVYKKDWDVYSNNIFNVLSTEGIYQKENFTYFVENTTKENLNNNLNKLYENSCSTCKQTIETLKVNNNHYLNHDYNCKFLIGNLTNELNICKENLKIAEKKKENLMKINSFINKTNEIDSISSYKKQSYVQKTKFIVQPKNYFDDFFINNNDYSNLEIPLVSSKSLFDYNNNNNTWFGFSINSSLMNAFSINNISKDFLLYSENKFKDYEPKLQYKITKIIKTLSNFFGNNIYLKFINKITSLTDDIIDLKSFTEKKDLFFLKFFNNFGKYHNVNPYTLFKYCNNIDLDIIKKQYSNLLLALYDFNQCMVNASRGTKKNFNSYTISNFIEWFNNCDHNLILKKINNNYHIKIYFIDI